MRLLILDQFSDLGGAQQCLLELLPAVRARGWQAWVGLPGNGAMVARIRDGGFETTTLDCGPYANGRKSLADLGRFLAGTPRLARQIREMTDRVSPDMIYVNGPRLLPPAAGLERPVVFHAHRIIRAGAVRELCGFSLRNLGARVIGVCRFAAEPWVRFVGVERIRVIYNGVAGPEELAPRASRSAPKVGCLGRIAPEKGQLEFLKAAARIHRELPECRFAIYGAAVIADPEYERQVRAAAAGMPVELAGWTSDIQAALADLDLLLVPSDQEESTTRVILEAFAAGTPVIAFAAGGIPEVIEHGHTGFLARDADEMAQLALGLLCDRDRQAAIAAAAHESWRTNFTREKWQAGVLDYLETTNRNMAAAPRASAAAPASTGAYPAVAKR